MFLFNDSAYRKYLTATNRYDYENGGGMDYDQIPAANPETTAMMSDTRRQIPTNFSCFIWVDVWCVFCLFFMQILYGSYAGQYLESMFFLT